MILLRKNQKITLPAVKNLGQVFSPDNIVRKMIALRNNKGSVLEPSCGKGAFLKYLKGAVGIELDKKIIQNPKVLSIDFFSYPTTYKFDTIIGNPPYVKYQDINSRTKKLLPMKGFDRRSNLYLFFIAKCIKHLRPGGELIFITPRDFLKATSARTLNTCLFEHGTITHFLDLGDKMIFKGFTPNCAIWRWEKDKFNRLLMDQKNIFFNHHKGQLWFGEQKATGPLSCQFEVKVGAVSGADPIFTSNKRGNKDMVCSFTARTGHTRRMIYNLKDKSLFPYKKELMKRRIKTFNEKNWWEWGRNYCNKNGPRIYVNCKTRNPKPFFMHKSEAYDGSVMALFPKDPSMDLKKAVYKLNKVNWPDLGFVCDRRLLFTQRSLENAPVELSL